MLIAAVAQHDLRVTPVPQWLQGQAVGVLEAVRRSDEVFSIAAPWDRTRTELGEDVVSCAIITMPANELLTENAWMRANAPRTVPRSPRPGSPAISAYPSPTIRL
jgi:hypothetical protein